MTPPLQSSEWLEQVLKDVRWYAMEPEDAKQAILQKFEEAQHQANKKVAAYAGFIDGILTGMEGSGIDTRRLRNTFESLDSLRPQGKDVSNGRRNPRNAQ